MTTHPSKYKIAFLCPYFGGFPWYFRYFVKSCAYNQDVDFYIITDSNVDMDIEVPDNVKMVYCSFSDLTRKISKKLGLTVSINKPYKLCDFKPTYGVVFQDIIVKGNYSFWGHCDIDIIFGRIRHFITDELLEQYDVISVRHEYTSGFFMLYRNIGKINYLFKKSRDYEYVLSSPKNFCFDECSLHHRELLNGVSVNDVLSHIDAMTFVVTAEHEKGNIRACFDLFVLEGKPGRVIWNNGILSLEHKYEALLYHIMTIKDNPGHVRKGSSPPADIFEINPLTIVFPAEKELMAPYSDLIKLNKSIYEQDPQVQITFGAYRKSESGRFRTCGVLA